MGKRVPTATGRTGVLLLTMQVMGEWLKEYTSKLMEAKGILPDDQLLPAGGGGDLSSRRRASVSHHGCVTELAVLAAPV